MHIGGALLFLALLSKALESHCYIIRLRVPECVLLYESCELIIQRETRDFGRKISHEKGIEFSRLMPLSRKNQD